MLSKNDFIWAIKFENQVLILLQRTYSSFDLCKQSIKEAKTFHMSPNNLFLLITLYLALPDGS